MARKSKEVWEFGDFQTPPDLAAQVVNLLARHGFQPTSVIEPTCGVGAFVCASVEGFEDAKEFVGLEINGEYIKKLRERLELLPKRQIKVFHESFFNFDWQPVIDQLPEPILIIGNPPWVTSSELSSLNSKNLPEKSNFQGRTGIDALMGKANFDISEWMLLKYLDWLKGKKGMIAVLCKTAVARKILVQAWKSEKYIKGARIYKLDALRHFGASVDASLFMLQVSAGDPDETCQVFDSLDDVTPTQVIGHHDNLVIQDFDTYRRWQHLYGKDASYVWRSGVKHDCSAVMELEVSDDQLVNGLDYEADLEEDYVYPLLKSSDVANSRIADTKKRMIVTQKFTGEDTMAIACRAPKTWEYLIRFGDRLDKRGSSIYKKRCRFSVFGIGDYTFAPWKVAVSGLYKRHHFVCVGPIGGRSVVFDDTVYFLPCQTEAEARLLERMLNSDVAREFMGTMIFWDDKRPITVDLLKRVNLLALARELGEEEAFLNNLKTAQHAVKAKATGNQLSFLTV